MNSTKSLHARHEYLLNIHDELLSEALQGTQYDQTVYYNWLASAEGKELATLDLMAERKAESEGK